MKLFFICKDPVGYYDFSISSGQSIIGGRCPKAIESLLESSNLKDYKILYNLKNNYPESKHRCHVIPITSFSRVAFHLFHDGQMCWFEAYFNRGGFYVNNEWANGKIFSIGNGDLLQLNCLNFRVEEEPCDSTNGSIFGGQ